MGRELGAPFLSSLLYQLTFIKGALTCDFKSFTSSVTLKYLNKGTGLGRTFFSRRLFVWDSLTVHVRDGLLTLPQAKWIVAVYA